MARCIDCGYLAARAVESRQLVEVEKDVRETGVPPARPSDRFYSQERAPVCFVGAADLHEEILAELGSLVPGTDRKQVLDGLNGRFLVKQWERDRPACDANGMFTKWQMGFSPKEHREMCDRQLERQQQQRQNRVTMVIAGLSVLVAVLGITVGSWINLTAAQIQRDGQPTINVSPASPVAPPISIVSPTPVPTSQSSPSTSSDQR